MEVPRVLCKVTDKRKATRSEQGIAAKAWWWLHVESRNNAMLVFALRVSLQAVIGGLFFNHHSDTVVHKNKTTSNRLMTHYPSL